MEFKKDITAIQVFFVKYVENIQTNLSVYQILGSRGAGAQGCDCTVMSLFLTRGNEL